MNISLLVTSHARGLLFEKSLPSILDQLIPGDEIVVVSDGPADNMPWVLKGALIKVSNDPATLAPINHKYLETGNIQYRGGSIAKNAALKACSNELIIINDPEVMHLSPCITMLRKYFSDPANKRKFVTVGTMYTAPDEHQKTIREANFLAHSQAPFIAGVMKDELMAVGGWDERYTLWGNDDNDLMHRLGMNGVTVELNEGMVGYHQWHTRAPQEAIGDANESLLYEPNKKMIANEGKTWGEL